MNTPVTAREGIRELIFELGKAESQRTPSSVLFLVHSMKWIHLYSIHNEPPRALLIRSASEFTVGYTMQAELNDPALDNHVEVVRTDDGELYFIEDGK